VTAVRRENSRVDPVDVLIRRIDPPAHGLHGPRQGTGVWGIRQQAWRAIRSCLRRISPPLIRPETKGIAPRCADSTPA
jgi:hypothetical protein